MTESSRKTTLFDYALKPRRRKLRVWFYAGLFLTFVGFLLFTDHFFYTSDAVVRCKLWQYYLLSIQLVFTSAGTLGPTSEAGTQAFMALLTHIVMSSLGGLALLAIGAVVRRVHARGRATPKPDSPAGEVQANG